MAESEKNDNYSQQEIFSKSVKAGKRTYFFDVKSTRSKDYYLVITESKKKFGEEGEKPFFEKHKIFLYKEDFDKFSEGLSESINYIKTYIEGIGKEESGSDSGSKSSFSDIDFDDLGSGK